MTDHNYIYHETEGVPVKTWTKGVPIEDSAMAQLRNIAALPFIHKHVAAMPDVHFGSGARPSAPSVSSITRGCW